MKPNLRSSVAWSIIIAVTIFSGLPSLAADADYNSRLSLSISLGKERAYPGEAVPVTATFRVNNAAVRNIGYPRLATPGVGSVTFGSPVQFLDPLDPNTTLYRFESQLSGAKPGEATVGPASLDCEVMEQATGSAAFFGGQVPHAVKLSSAPVTLTVLPLPIAGKPALFSGAIGTFSLSVKAIPAQVATGDPITITTTIRGNGSLSDAGCPTITGPALQSFPVRATQSASQLICEQVVVANKVLRQHQVGHVGFANLGQHLFVGHVGLLV